MVHCGFCRPRQPGCLKKNLIASRTSEHPTHLLFKSRVRARGLFSEHSCLVISVTLRVFETSADTLARNHVAQGKYAEAEPRYERATEIWEKALGPDDPKVAAVLNNRAVLLTSQVRTVRIFQEFS